ncbi:putative autophagy-related protein 11 [Palaemon carinicauda]|uniref:putative autophagy-related protein 11 n=1 Tax=Palaemon carinicauda TaxID=392227 RepID=UPI0035B6088E
MMASDPKNQDMFLVVAKTHLATVTTDLYSFNKARRACREFIFASVALRHEPHLGWYLIKWRHSCQFLTQPSKGRLLPFVQELEEQPDVLLDALQEERDTGEDAVHEARPQVHNSRRISLTLLLDQEDRKDVHLTFSVGKLEADIAECQFGSQCLTVISQDQGEEYQEVKRSVLKVYQMTPEYYNERLQSLRKDEKITFLDYAYKVSNNYVNKFNSYSRSSTGSVPKQNVIVPQQQSSIPPPLSIVKDMQKVIIFLKLGKRSHIIHTSRLQESGKTKIHDLEPKIEFLPLREELRSVKEREQNLIVENERLLIENVRLNCENKVMQELRELKGTVERLEEGLEIRIQENERRMDERSDSDSNSDSEVKGTRYSKDEQKGEREDERKGKSDVKKEKKKYQDESKDDHDVKERMAKARIRDRRMISSMNESFAKVENVFDEMDELFTEMSVILGPDENEVDRIVHDILGDMDLYRNSVNIANDCEKAGVNERVYEGPVTRSRGPVPNCD